MDFSSSYNINGSVLKYKKLRARQGLRIFRYTTKFKKFTFGVSKNTQIRKTYIKKKRKSSNIVFQKLTYYWCNSYLKKKSIESFFYFMFSFAYFVPIPHVSFIYKKVQHRSFVETLTLNLSSVSQKTAYNNSIFRKKKLYFKDSLRYHECSYITFRGSSLKTTGLSKLLPWGMLFDKQLYPPRVLTKAISYPSRYQSLFYSILSGVLRLVIQLSLTLRGISQLLVFIK
jgi:hypothetical protein